MATASRLLTRLTRLTRPVTRTVTLALAALIASMVVLTGLQLVTQNQAHAAVPTGILNACDTNTSFPVPIAPPARDNYDGVPIDAKKTASPAGNKLEFNRVPWTTSPVAAYDGAGLKLFSFSTTVCSGSSVATMVETNIANTFLTYLTVLPTKILGAVLGFVFSTTLSDALIGGLSGAVNALQSNLFLRWAPLMVSAALVGILWNLARKRGQKFLSEFGWLVLVVAAIGGLVSPQGVGLVKNVNDYTSSITACATFAMTAGCDENGTMGSSSIESSMLESLATPTWGIASMGSRATQPLTEGSMQFVGRGDDPQVSDPGAGTPAIDIPKDAIPAVIAGKPTWGEAWRWTQTYTQAEMQAMAATPALRCDFAQSPSLADLSNPSSRYDGARKGELCWYKWVVRAALVSTIAQTDPTALGVITGVDDTRTSSVASGLGIMPLSVGIIAMGLMILLYQIELVGMFIIAPVVALVALKNPQAAHKWGQEVAGAVMKRIAVGVTAGIVLFFVQRITTAMAGSMPAGAGLLFGPLLTALVCILALIAGFMLFKKINGMLLSGAGLPEQDAAGDGLKKVASTAALGLAAATGGASAAGAGLRLKGAAAGLMRSGAVGGNAVRSGSRAGQRAGDHVRQQNAGGRDTTTPPTPQAPPAGAPVVGSPVVGGVGSATAWAGLTAHDPQARAETARTRQDAARARSALQHALDDVDRFNTTRTASERSRVGALVRGGMGQDAAEQQAMSEIRSHAERLQATVRSAENRVRKADDAAMIASDPEQRPRTEWAEIADQWARSTATVEDAATALGLDGNGRAAFERYRATIRIDPAGTPPVGQTNPEGEARP